VSEGTGWVSQYEDDRGDDAGGPSRPPIWVVIVVVVSVAAGAWLLASQGSTDGDLDTSAATDPFEPSFATTSLAVVESATDSTPTSAPALSVDGNPPAAITPGDPGVLRGYVAVTSRGGPPLNRDALWVFQPGGHIVSRSDDAIPTGDVEYPILTTSGRLLIGDRIFDILLTAPPVSLWTNGTVIPGSGRGTVWLWLQSHPFETYS
jgi:hypothetical protein